MYRAMVGVGVFCGLLIVSVFQVTLPRHRAQQGRSAARSHLPRSPERDARAPAIAWQRPAASSSSRATMPAGSSSTRVTTTRSSWSASPSKPRAWATKTSSRSSTATRSPSRRSSEFRCSKARRPRARRQDRDGPGLSRKLQEPRRLCSGGRFGVGPSRRAGQARREDASLGSRRHHGSHDLVRGDRRPARPQRGVLGASNPEQPERLPRRRLSDGFLQKQHRRVHQGPLEGEPRLRPGAGHVPGARGFEHGDERARHGFGDGVRADHVQHRGLVAAELHPQAGAHRHLHLDHRDVRDGGGLRDSGRQPRSATRRSARSSPSSSSTA